jgi:hypothetical protein
MANKIVSIKIISMKVAMTLGLRGPTSLYRRQVQGTLHHDEIGETAQHRHILRHWAERMKNERRNTHSNSDRIEDNNHELQLPDSSRWKEARHHTHGQIEKTRGYKCGNGVVRKPNLSQPFQRLRVRKDEP